jgi:hypothetical protein
MFVRERNLRKLSTNAKNVEMKIVDLQCPDFFQILGSRFDQAARPGTNVIKIFTSVIYEFS